MHQPQMVEIQHGRLVIEKKRHQAADFDSETVGTQVGQTSRRDPNCIRGSKFQHSFPGSILLALNKNEKKNPLYWVITPYFYCMTVWMYTGSSQGLPVPHVNIFCFQGCLSQWSWTSSPVVRPCMSPTSCDRTRFHRSCSLFALLGQLKGLKLYQTHEFCGEWDRKCLI